MSDQAADDGQHAALAAAHPRRTQARRYSPQRCWRRARGRRPGRPAAAPPCSLDARSDAGGRSGSSTLAIGHALRRGRCGLRAVARSDAPGRHESTTIWRSISAAGPHRDHPAEVQHRDPVGDLEDVVHVVRDDDARRALGRRAGGPARAPSPSGPRPSAAVGSSMITSLEFHSTALAMATDWRWPPDSEATGWRIERTVVTGEARQRLARRTLHRLLVEHEVPQRARGRGTCSGRCRGCRTARGPGTRSRCRARRRRAGVRMWTGWPSQQDLAAVGRVDAGDALDEHRLAGAVVADQRGDLPGRARRGRRRSAPAPGRSSCRSRAARADGGRPAVGAMRPASTVLRRLCSRWLLHRPRPVSPDGGRAALPAER